MMEVAWTWLGEAETVDPRYVLKAEPVGFTGSLKVG